MGVGDDRLAIHDSEFKHAALVGSRGTDTLATDLALDDIYVRGFENIV